VDKHWNVGTIRTNDSDYFSYPEIIIVQHFRVTGSYVRKMRFSRNRIKRNKPLQIKI